MRSEFVRFVTAEIEPGSNQPTGIIQAAYRLRDGDALSVQTREELNAELEWFKSHLPEPDRFVLTRSKGFYRRQSVAISWFKAEGDACILHAERLGQMLKECGVPVQRLRTTHPGYIVYEDALQVVTIPFRDR
jgi:hypothetical protein